MNGTLELFQSDRDLQEVIEKYRYDKQVVRNTPVLFWTKLRRRKYKSWKDFGDNYAI